jgi:hypothetical protein
MTLTTVSRLFPRFTAAACTAFIACVGLVAACGDDDGGGCEGIECHLSDDYLYINVHQRPANYTCIGDADTAISYAQDTQVSGTIVDYENEYPADGVTIEVYTSLEELYLGNFFDQQVSDAAGDYSILVPAGVTRMTFRTYKDPDPNDDYFDTVEMNEPVAGFSDPPPTTNIERYIIAMETVETIPATLGIPRIPGTAIVAGTAYDCDHEDVQYGAIRAFNAARDTLSKYEGADRNAFYFTGGLPSRRQMYTDPEGQFVIANLPEGDYAYVEFWGRVDAANLPGGFQDCNEGCMVSECPIPRLADVVVITDLDPHSPCQ